MSKKLNTQQMSGNILNTKPNRYKRQTANLLKNKNTLCAYDDIDGDIYIFAKLNTLQARHYRH